ncbi:ATP-dependent Clp protease proteolytic subunit [Desulfosporosinus sp.]|uniref:ClpP family protease n=1 Tax=Desulfosporosinus sp. TaxID=157907 RepID=UPI000E805A93|nr:ATP-dependent Clp protease proteolytic subunit [Desulfosporosinus sp.]MBC2724392.1 ATP-dependent Clp protease proteolytic subunit [Desulfosporosinus sp.]MBC2725068.1 ATP-dependent Clp protease proteolytic subunit [Desulfosporosinus sp.]HBV87954.1 translocation-enhancing protein TepA [Desulfosporosinus sp.]
MLSNETASPEDDKNIALSNLKELGQIQIPSATERIYCLPIIGQIEGHQILPAQSKTTKYEHIIPQLLAVEQNPNTEGILVILNTAGGDVEAGLAIAEMLSSLSKPSVSLVLGGGHSIGIPIAVSCTKSFIAPTGTMTVHPIRYTGLVINGHQQFDYLRKMQERINQFIYSHSKITPEKLEQFMFTTGELAQDIGTILIGNEAVEAGLIQAVGGVREAFKELNSLIPSRSEE